MSAEHEKTIAGETQLVPCGPCKTIEWCGENGCAAPAPSAGETCQMCEGRGEIGGWDSGDNAFRTEPCPECLAPAPSAGETGLRDAATVLLGCWKRYREESDLSHYSLHNNVANYKAWDALEQALAAAPTTGET